jgi:YNFM family putative membrane transporter
MQSIEMGSPAYRRTSFCMLLGSMSTFALLYYPQTLIYIFAKQFHLSPATAGLTISAATLTLAAGLIFNTLFSNAWGRKKIMSISLFSASIFGVLSAYSPNFEIMILFRMLQGFVLSGFTAIAITYLSEEISPKHLGRMMGIYVSGSAVGAFVGRVIVSSLTDLYSWHIAILVLGLFSLLCSLLFSLLLPESRNFKKGKLSLGSWLSGLSRGIKNKRLLYIYGMGFLLLGAYVSLFNYIGFPLSKPPYQLSQTLIGFLFIFQLGGSWSPYFFGTLTEKYSRSWLMIATISMSLIGACMTLSSHLFILIIGLILFASGFLAGHSIASGWVGIIADHRTKLYASSLYLLFYYIGSSVIGWLGGLFLNHFGWSGVIFMACGLLIITGFFAIILSRSHQVAQIKHLT